MKLGKLNRRSLVLGGTALACGSMLASPLIAQGNYPEKPISIILPTREGGGSDRVGRAFVDVWKTHLDAQFEFEYFPGAAGQIGYENFLERDRDGHTLLLSSVMPEVIMMTLQAKTIEPGRDVTWFPEFASAPVSIWTSASSSLSSLEDLIEEGKKRTVNIAVSRLPHPASIGVLALGKATGASFRLVPYGGGNPAAMATLSGEVDATAISVTVPLTLGEKARVLGVFEDENPVAEATGNAPTVNSVIGGSIPPLTQSLAMAAHPDFLRDYPERAAMLRDTMMQSINSEPLIAALAKLKTPRNLAILKERDTNQVVSDVAALAHEFADLLSEA